MMMSDSIFLLCRDCGCSNAAAAVLVDADEGNPGGRNIGNTMSNPYSDKKPEQFWKSAVAQILIEDVAPVPSKRFSFVIGDRVATTGSCFAQHVSAVIKGIANIEFVQEEPVVEGQPLFSASFGNVYTVRQLRQLFEEAFEVTNTPPAAWLREDGRFVDGYRPYIHSEGFASVDDVIRARANHLAAVRRMFRDCTVLVFTLGLTECWVGEGRVFPVPHGILGDLPNEPSLSFHNQTYEDIVEDLNHLVDSLNTVNLKLRIILTVSPVPLVATYTDEHVLTATVHSKAILRTVCGYAERKWENVFYFPSFEIVSSHYNHGSYFENNKRTVKAAGVDHVMKVFRATFCGEAIKPADTEVYDYLHDAAGQNTPVICDEEKFQTNVGF